MMSYKLYLFAVLLSAMLLNSCRPANPGEPVYAPSEILNSDATFGGYLAQNLSLLTENFAAYDENDKPISKMEFLKQLITDQYLFIKLNSTDNKLYFKLYKLKPGSEQAHCEVMYAYLHSYYEHYQQVGKKFPDFNFTDLNGNNYNSQNTKGKIVVFKCWFIKCQVCNEHIPALNTLVKKYQGRKDMSFISVATDAKPQLQDFLKNREFEFAVVPGQNDFITHSLNTNEYPTYYIINKQGIVVNVVDTPEEIEYSLENDI